MITYLIQPNRNVVGDTFLYITSASNYDLPNPFSRFWVSIATYAVLSWVPTYELVYSVNYPPITIGKLRKVST